MSNPNMESIVKELLELKRMKEELEAEITAMEDEIKKVMGDEELLTAGAFKVSWKSFISSRVDTTALKKAMPEHLPQHSGERSPRKLPTNRGARIFYHKSLLPSREKEQEHGYLRRSHRPNH